MTAFKMLPPAFLIVLTTGCGLLITSNIAIANVLEDSASVLGMQAAEADVTTENVDVENNLESFDQKAAPWWEQQEEAAKRKAR